MWIAAAVTDTDRAAPPSDQVVLLDFDSETFRLAYDVVANETLWFLHHGLWDLARQPTFDSAWRQAWVAYEHYNEAFATAICERAPADSVVLVQDYHLALTGELVRVRRPDLRTVHFTHTAYATPEEQGALPADVRQRLAVGMAGFDRCGFHSARWEQRYRRGAETIGAQPPDTFVAPLAPDASGLRSVAGSAECDTKLAAIDAAADGRFLLVRVDRLELSKNILRGFLAFDSLLRRRADLRGHITFAAYVHASRTGVEAYRRYAEEIRHAAAAINERFGTPKWTPVLLETTDDFARSGCCPAAVRRAARQPDPRWTEPRCPRRAARERAQRQRAVQHRGLACSISLVGRRSRCIHSTSRRQPRRSRPPSIRVCESVSRALMSCEASPRRARRQIGSPLSSK